MIAKHAKKFGRDWDLYLPQLLFAYGTKPHESTGESPFYLLYGRDACLPTEAALSTPKSPYVVSVDDYKTELTTGLTESWKQARNYDRRAKEVNFQPSGRVMVYMPHEDQGKKQKLAPPYHGPFRILEVLPNCLVVKPVDRPDDPAIKVNMDRVTQCSQELPGVPWLGLAKHRKRSAKKGKQLKKISLILTQSTRTISESESTRTCSKQQSPRKCETAILTESIEV